MKAYIWVNLPGQLCAIGALSALLLLAACGGTVNPSTNTPNAAPPGTSSTAHSMPGALHGGEQPITGSTLTLYAAGVPANAAPTTLGTTLSLAGLRSMRTAMSGSQIILVTA
jgi:hypothetical protein